MLGWLWGILKCLTGIGKKGHFAYESAGAGSLSGPTHASGENLICNIGDAGHIAPRNSTAASQAPKERSSSQDLAPAASPQASANPPSPQPLPPSTVKRARNTRPVEEPSELATPGPRKSTGQQPSTLPLSPLPSEPATNRHALKDITTSSVGQAPSPLPAAAASPTVENWGTPQPHDAEMPAPSATQPFRRYMVDSGKVVGVANTVARYRETKPVTARETPFNVRVLREMEIEERLLHAEEAEA